MRAAKRILARRTEGFTESVIREMTRLNAVHGAINLAQGFPNFPAPAAVKDAAKRAIDADVNQYAITWGSKSLRDALSKTYADLYAMQVDPETMLTVTCGATEAMISTLLAIVDPGDEVIVLEPFYENYGPDTDIAGAKPVYVALRPPRNVFDPDELRAAFTPRTKAIIVNTPNNPTGRVFTRQELSLIAELCVEHDVIAITDEIYEHIRYAGDHHALATWPGMAERTITISGLSKTFSCTGWRIGYAIAPEAESVAIRKVHDFLTVGAAAPLQEAGAVALGLPDDYYLKLAANYQQRRDVLLDILERHHFTCYKPFGAYYIMTDISTFGFADDVEFARYLVKEVGVAAVPGSSFYKHAANGRTKLRFCFCKRDETLIEADRRMAKLVPVGVHLH
jgi:aspartate/methionine/tyrosine aminotransferase